MEVASIPTGIRAEYGGLALRTRGRSHARSACHTPGCRHEAVQGRRFCRSCQATLDKVRMELMNATPVARRRAVRQPD
jgi:hypothetical protein